MKNIKIELPKLPTDEIMVSKKRVAKLEYLHQGKEINEDEAIAVLHQWIDFICQLIPQTKVTCEKRIEEAPSQKKWLQKQKNTIRNLDVILGASNRLIENHLPFWDEKIASARDDDGYFEIFLLTFDWIYNDNHISSVTFGFCNERQFARVYVSDEDGQYLDSIECVSWEDGIKEYVKSGEEWFNKHLPPKIDLPATPDSSNFL